MDLHDNIHYYGAKTIRSCKALKSSVRHRKIWLNKMHDLYSRTQEWPKGTSMQVLFVIFSLSGLKEMLVIVSPFSLNTHKVWTVVACLI